jgi:hypothetical protein
MESLTRRDEKTEPRGRNRPCGGKSVLPEGFEMIQDEIAQEAQFTKRTLYQYFATKKFNLCGCAKGVAEIAGLHCEFLSR